VREQPQIRRLSLAVLVDGTEDKGADGKTAWQPRSADELASIARLVRTAIGYDEKRGDHVEVVNMRFAAEPDTAEAPARTLFGLPIARADLIRLAQTALLGVVAMAALLLVLRPMVMRLTAPVGRLPALPGGPGAPALSGGGVPSAGEAEAGALLAAANPATGELPFLTGVAGALEDESMVRIANIEGQMRASSIRRLGELIDKHPEESLSIVRAWMLQERR
jgi:flagellar M-ring protein FliF